MRVSTSSTQRERSLSDYWRESTDDRVLELISVLHGARNLIGLMGSDMGVRWSGDGTSYTDFSGHVVSLDYGPLVGCKAPFPGGAVDEVIGYAAHEGGHCLFSREGKDQVLAAQMNSEIGRASRSRLSTRFRRAWLDGERNPLPDGKGGFVNPVLVELCQHQNVLEDAYVDTHVGERWEVLGEHIKVARRRMAARSNDNGTAPDLDGIAAQARPSRSEVTTLWVNMSLYGEARPRRCSRRVREALDVLLKQTRLAIREDDACQRQVMTVDVADYLFQHFPDLRPKPQPSQQAPASGSGLPGQEGNQGDQGRQPEPGPADDTDSGDDADQPEESGGADEPAEDDAETGGQNGSGQSDPGEDAQGGGGRGDILRRLVKALQQRAEDQAEADQDDGDPGDADQDGDGSGEGGEGGDPGEQAEAGQGDDGESDSPSDQGDGAGDAPGSFDEAQDRLPDDPDGFDDRDPVEVPEDILVAIAEALEFQLQDLTEEVAEILNLPPHLVAAQAKKARYNQRKAQEVTSRVQKQVAEVRRVFDRQNQSASRQLKGLERGKVDSRRLARVGAGDLHVFQRKQVLGKPDMDVGLVLDVSGSMNGFLRVVDETAAIFAEALSHKQGVNFAAWAYTGGQARVQLTRLCDRQMGKLHLADVDHGGGTPSGAAIAAAKVLMDRMPSHRKLLLHFTDGDPDSVYHVETAVKECKKAGLAVHCIALAGVSTSRLDYQYGRGNWQVIQRVPDLPRAVMEILKKLD